MHIAKRCNHLPTYRHSLCSVISTWDFRIGAVYRARSLQVWFGGPVIWPPWRFASPPLQCFSERNILKWWLGHVFEVRWRAARSSSMATWSGASAAGSSGLERSSRWKVFLRKSGWVSSKRPKWSSSSSTRTDSKCHARNFSCLTFPFQWVPPQWSGHPPLQLREEDRLHLQGLGTR